MSDFSCFYFFVARVPIFALRISFRHSLFRCSSFRFSISHAPSNVDSRSTFGFRLIADSKFISVFCFRTSIYFRFSIFSRFDFRFSVFFEFFFVLRLSISFDSRLSFGRRRMAQKKKGTAAGRKCKENQWKSSEFS